MKLGYTIKQLRKLRKISQGELAIKTNLTQTYVSLIETDKKEPTMATLRSISNVLEISIPLLILKAAEPSDFNNSEKATILLPVIDSMINQII